MSSLCSEDLLLVLSVTPSLAEARPDPRGNQEQMPGAQNWSESESQEREKGREREQLLLLISLGIVIFLVSFSATVNFTSCFTLKVCLYSVEFCFTSLGPI